MHEDRTGRDWCRVRVVNIVDVSVDPTDVQNAVRQVKRQFTEGHERDQLNDEAEKTRQVRGHKAIGCDQWV